MSSNTSRSVQTIKQRSLDLLRKLSPLRPFLFVVVSGLVVVAFTAIVLVLS